ncbi:serine hydrolase domain-containing protein [Actinopolymorpha alba]|uniref:serine hydrolase domain-containing protein n=1 Tax=Actinopolymorpha alba TaxID=533267 RepID=UPI0003676002|nr:serine hydrolase domain-containing protein [Actinopolymorpha alba]
MSEPTYGTVIEEARAEFGVPGVSWVVIDSGQIARAGTSGVQAAGETRPVTGTTRFQACSISKPIAALAMLRLVDRGVLDLDSDINAYLTSWRLPRNADWQPVVTLRQLASHSAGLTTSGFPGYKRTDELPTTVQILCGSHPANTFDVRVDTVPGTQFRYSGGGTLAMQLLLEDVTGTPFPALMRELVLDPLCMGDSDYTQPPPAEAYDRLASGHDIAGAVVAGGWHVYPEMATAGLWTTPSDLCRYALAVRAAYAGAPGALISQHLAREMLTPQVPATERIGGLSAVGLGPFVSVGGAARFGHSGGNEGFKCHLLAYQDAGVGAAVMTNSDLGIYVVQRAFAAIAKVYDWPDFPMTVDDPELPTESTLAKIAGRYRLRDGVELEITPADYNLRVTFNGQAPMTFTFTGTNDDGTTVFNSVATETKLRLNCDGALTFDQNGQTIACDRL